MEKGCLGQPFLWLFKNHLLWRFIEALPETLCGCFVRHSDNGFACRRTKAFARPKVLATQRLPLYLVGCIEGG